MLTPCFSDDVLHVAPDATVALRDLLDDGADWFHTFQFSNGLVSNGRDPSPKKLHHLCLPQRLDGMRVLDIGAYEGFFSFHMKQRGAESVVAADEFVWNWPNSVAKQHFDGLRHVLKSDVKDVTTSVENLSTNISGKFDIVLFLGVLYHAPNMIQYLEQVASVTKTVCVLETYLDMLDVESPGAVFYPPGVLNNDDSNYWGPNVSAVVNMCQRVGFSNVNLVNFWDINSNRTLVGGNQWGAVKTGRGVFYAYR